VNLELNFIEVFNPLTLYVNNSLCDLFLFVQKVNKIIVCEVHVNAIVIINVFFSCFGCYTIGTLYLMFIKRSGKGIYKRYEFWLTHDITMSEGLHGSFEIIVYL
jgi:hypothetical protein